MTISPDDYRAAHEVAILVDRSRLGMFKITGRSRLDLIHRLSTQALNDLRPGEGAATVLTTDIGRIIDRVILYATSDTVYMLTGEDHTAPLGRYLMSNVFFNDDFQLEDISPDTIIFGVHGPQAAERLAAAGFPEVDLPRHHWRQAEPGGVTTYLHRTDPVAGDGYFLTASLRDRDALWQTLAGTGIAPVDEDAYDYLRVEAGLPRFGRELSLDYIPLEANLWDDVSFHKGCYVGQEIIARMESRGKLAKRLVRLRPGAPIKAGTEIVAGTRPAGMVTSAVDGPAGPIALGYVRTALLDEGAALNAGGVTLSVLDP